uniref:Peptidyl prolyl cis trans isomerase FKBP5 n=1 Tax=Echinococcus granulosus TaxID=6210 RepID=A0A068WTW7_ECHGR|nr:peptidyl prolyl cis trans isomerase FKBP5 [Echinococcus granulosus]
MGIILHIKQFKVISRNRASTQSVLRGVSDGSKCWITLTATENIPISHCFLCTGENCPHIIYLQPQQQQKFCLRLGLAPDLSDSLRGAIENALQTLNVGSTAVIEVKLSEHSSCQVTAHLDGFSAPQAFYPTPVNDEEEEKNQPTLRKKAATGDNVEATSSHGNGTNIAWRTSTPRLWFAQASVLKARGSSLFNSAPRGDAHNLSPIIAAFACYSRALQLVTLIGAALDLSVRAEEVEKEKEACEVTFGLVGGDYIDLDGDAQYSVDPERVEVDVEAMEKVHFSLLSNMALCQLKAGCPAYAVKLCTQALEIAPQDNTLLAASQEVDEEEEEEGGRGIDLRDVEKVLYRRASAYLLMEEFEAGIEDANRLLQLNPTNQAGEKVLHELQASLRAHNATMARMMKKAFQ